MTSNSIKRTFFTESTKFVGIILKLETIIDERVNDACSVSKDSDNADTYDTRTTRSDQDASNDMSYDDECAIARKRYKADNGEDKKESNGVGT